MSRPQKHTHINFCIEAHRERISRLTGVPFTTDTRLQLADEIAVFDAFALTPAGEEFNKTQHTHNMDSFHMVKLLKAAMSSAASPETNEKLLSTLPQ